MLRCVLVSIPTPQAGPAVNADPPPSHPPPFPLLGRITRILANERMMDSLLAPTFPSIPSAVSQLRNQSPVPVASLVRERWIIGWPLRPPVNETSRHSPLSFSPSFLSSFLRPDERTSARACVRSSCQAASHVSLSLRRSRHGRPHDGRKEGRKEVLGTTGRIEEEWILFILVAFVLISLLPWSAAAAA